MTLPGAAGTTAPKSNLDSDYQMLKLKGMRLKARLRSRRLWSGRRRNAFRTWRRTAGHGWSESRLADSRSDMVPESEKVTESSSATTARVNELRSFVRKLMVPSEGIEPPTFWFEARHSIR